MNTVPTTRIALALAACVLPALAGAQVQTSPLPGSGGNAPAVSQSVLPGSRQTGAVTLELPGDEQVTVRSYEPDGTVQGNYRISFEALDTDGDGFVSRAEAAANPTLDGEFRAVDTDNDGRASRAEQSGWIGAE